MVTCESEGSAFDSARRACTITIERPAVVVTAALWEIPVKENVVTVLVNALYLLALINPISKVSVLSVLSPGKQRRELRAVTTKSSLIALSILLGAMVFGDLLLRIVFHVQLHSLQLAGGLVLFWVGFNALRQGVFFEQGTQTRFEDIALVPLACPMIAGPATITASIALRTQSGLALPVASLVIAIAVNYVIMQLSGPISAVMTRFNVLGALIRITGLIVMTMGTQMALDGFAAWQSTIPQ